MDSDAHKEAPRKAGRPKKGPDMSKPPQAPRVKVKLKPDPVDAKKRYSKMFGNLNVAAIYGVDEFTRELIEALWKDPHIEKIYCTDLNQDKLARINKEISQRSFSLYRWEACSVGDFMEYPSYPVVVVAKEHLAEATRRNKHQLQLVVLEEL